MEISTKLTTQPDDCCSGDDCCSSDLASPIAVKEFASDVSAVVASYDGSADIWPGFFGLLSRFWPDLPYPLYLVSNHLTFPDQRVTALRVGDDLSWSETLARGLERVASRYVLLILDDFFLTASVDTALVSRMHAAMGAKGAAYLRLVPNPAADTPCVDMPGIGTIDKGAPNRTSLQMAFWDRRVLLDLLRREESAWDFEIKGSRRSDALREPFLGVCQGFSAVPYRHVLRRGKLLPDAVRFFAPLGVSFDFSKRRFESELNLRWQASAVRRHLGRAWRIVTRRSPERILD
ncbi:MAG TPA: hypothetical protein VE396_19490 [Xanthobacteraceae bacterium]|nr:hypothetical protein [Xanthobacteraceae bacterium]